jgi:hypothetical protein
VGGSKILQPELTIMVPRAIRRQLGRLRRRESLLRLIWGLSRALALVFVLLALACLADWTIDRFRETPRALRALLVGVQVLVAAAALAFFLVLPLFRRPSDTELALRVEETVPDLGHRLISAVQLNRPGALIQGMSPELIARVTDEAEKRAARIRFTQIADHRRLKWSAILVAGVLVPAGVSMLAGPETVMVLLSRQLLADVEIPRSVHLASTAPEVWRRPTGEEVVLLFQATGEGVNEDLEGEVRLEPVGQPAERYTLKLESMQEAGRAIFAVRIPPSATDFSYRAWLADGRTPRESEVRYSPRPIVIEQKAWVGMPAYVGLRPKSQTPYEQESSRAEVVGVQGGSARVWVKVQKPVQMAAVELLGAPEPGKTDETILRRIPLNLDNEGQQAEGSFDLRAEETAYRVVVRDEHQFDNLPPPRRGIRIIPEEPPRVVLLREEFRPVAWMAKLIGTSGDFEVEGMPVPSGGRIPIAYACAGPYGLGRAQLRFRVLKRAADSSPETAVQDEERWLTLPLIEKAGTPEAGPFDPRRGAFHNSHENDQVQFHAVPSEDPEKVPGRTLGGGRFDFQTKGIPDGKGGYIDILPGDQLEFYVEVYADKNPDSTRPSARSEIRRKVFVTGLELVRWLEAMRQEEQRIRQLEARQRGVFDSN